VIHSYGPQERNLMDLYVPLSCLPAIEEPESLLQLITDPYPLRAEEKGGNVGAAAASGATVAAGAGGKGKGKTKEEVEAAAAAAAGSPGGRPVALFVHGG
jgi:hypothetical protein